MRVFRFIALVLALPSLLALAACEEEPPPRSSQVNIREVKPPKGPEWTGDLCVLIRNRAPFTVTGRVIMKSRERATFRISRNKTEKVCLDGTTYGNYTVSLVLTNFLTIPLFSCYTMVDQPVEIFAYKRGDGWRYNASCRRG